MMLRSGTLFLFGVLILYWVYLWCVPCRDWVDLWCWTAPHTDASPTVKFGFGSMGFAFLTAICELLLYACARIGNWLDVKDENCKAGNKFLWICHRSNLKTDVLSNQKVVVSDLNDLARKENLKEVQREISSMITHKSV